MVGPVQILHVEVSNLSREGGGQVEGPRVSSLIVFYDAKGYKTEEAKFKPDGSLLTRSIFTYQGEGKLAEVAELHSNGTLSRKLIYVLKPGGEEELIYDASGSFAGKVVRTYDDNRSLTGIARYTADNSLCFKMAFVNDEQGRVIEMAFYGGDLGASVAFVDGSSEQGGVAFEYIGADAAEPSGYGDGFLVSKTTLTYDDKGNVIRQVEHASDGVPVSDKVSANDTTGNPVEVTEYGFDGALRSRETYSREFDHWGNWVKEIKYEWNIGTGKFEPICATYRTISYYSES